ncbi:hypothetical protein Q4519_01035 [Motilimonas sp. 1_MG-2023]|uniref:hypothetical protein n=1 Tax=Motilimonas sp. 1_MG-2023 TaxID=3062672 RepID=UPI0026E37564|nr:hypothetical protein [Motilimonas sp. 1_MG-2023]MDO6524255.1 hypothetical protein [Motilimonas sp. 1_MG-2023]
MLRFHRAKSIHLFAITLLSFLNSSQLQANIIFSEDFEQQADWVAGYPNTNGVGLRPHANPAPPNWTVIRTDPAYAPSMGDTDRHESIEIGAFAGKARSGERSVVFYRDAKSDPNWKWWSDGILAKKFDQEYNEVYAEFYIKWAPNSDHPKALSKLFRILHTWGEGGEIFKGFRDGFNGPIAGWNYVHNNYGLRNTIWMRGYPPANHYYLESNPIKGLPREMLSGDMSLNFDNNITDLNQDRVTDNPNTKLVGMKSGLLIPQGGQQGMIHPREFFGDESITGWRKMAFYVKMNSAPGVADGHYEQWIDDQLVFANYQIAWVGADADKMVGWNAVKLGGNDYIDKSLPDSLRYEDWYAMDDLVVMDAHPHTPSAPSQLSVTRQP